jgi:uncharacterized membrane protein YccC
MTTYTMQARVGKFGAGFNRPPFDYSKIFNRIIIALMVLIAVIVWMKWSNKQDAKRMQSFDTCYTSYYNYALSTEYIPYMQGCMK